ncbi:hypothetical protein D3C80_1828100 [compost metagenome]
MVVDLFYDLRSGGVDGQLLSLSYCGIFSAVNARAGRCSLGAACKFIGLDFVSLVPSSLLIGRAAVGDCLHCFEENKFLSFCCQYYQYRVVRGRAVGRSSG